ncbi:MAG: putative RNA polymerase sigma factor FecI [Herbaspirillum frisingense]|uniref:Putative RNA polymerase sigma factor FecI n=1 Tax=Herbaspirillum frisingense TaxID=92645 RepID=A0A7V8JTZ6_9BURK|nr:MAG: putative RNA polymerase sigma factor FecI [Herbaspirillum frisingense]
MALFSNPPLGDSFEQVYHNHHGWLYGWLWRKLGSREDAAELAQDTFLRLLSSKPADSLQEPRAYLRTVAHGLMVNHWRRLELERAYLDALASRPELEAPSPEQRALVLESLVRIDAMLDQLPPKVRQAFLMSQLDGLTYLQIARQLGVSDRMVKKYMAQAMLQCMILLDQ